MFLTNSKLMRDADNAAIHVTGVPSTWLMTNAASHVARTAMEYCGDNKSAVIFCGSGNNGGDGVAAAVYLIRRGYTIRVFLVSDRSKMSPDTREMERRLVELGGALEDFDETAEEFPKLLISAGVIIDAIYGVGFHGELTGRALTAADMINASGVPVVAADVPSGVEADTGRVKGVAVRAIETVTFTLAKPGHFVEPGCTRCGKVTVTDIGIPRELAERAQTQVCAVTESDVSLPKRARVSHKGSYGKLLIIGGSVGYTGAPSLAARAAVHSGAGLVYLGVPSDIYNITAVKNDEAMPFPLASDDGRLSDTALPSVLERLAVCDVCLLGPGLSRSDALTKLVAEIISSCTIPLVLDADALNALSEDVSVLKRARCPVILTPHEGEFKRLGGSLTGDRIAGALAFSSGHNCVLVLKGHRTITAFPDGEVFINTTGNPGMAKGGSGDVLAGIIGALVGQMPLKQAVTTAVWLHGKAGDACAAELGEYSMTPGDIIGKLPAIMKDIERKE